MQKSFVNTVSIISSGKSFRVKPVHIEQGGCYLIQMKDVSVDGLVSTPLSIDLSSVNPGHLLRRGDLLFVAKGNRNYAFVYDSDYPAVAISLFFTIRPDVTSLDSGYLAWYINSDLGQKYFEKHRMGASVGNIRKPVLEQMPIVIPEMEQQRKISELATLASQERIITNQYLEKKEVLINQTIMNLIES